MRGRVMILDYVLAHPGEWLSTETERKSWFRDVAGISTSEMPSRVYPGRNGQFTRRYFIDKTPVSVSKEAPVRLVFVDPSYHSEEPFTSFLDLYHGLFAGLEQAEICYVSAHRWRFEKCAGTVQRTFCSDPNPALDRDRLLGYFEMESRYRDSNWKTFDFPEMQRLKADRDHFATADTSHFFDAWNRGGTAELARILVSENATETGSRVAFSTHLLTGNYDIFGRVTDVRGVTIPANSIVTVSSPQRETFEPWFLLVVLWLTHPKRAGCGGAADKAEEKRGATPHFGRLRRHKMLSAASVVGRRGSLRRARRCQRAVMQIN